MLASALISSLLLACATGLMIAHVRSWRAAKAQSLTAAELDFRQRQFHRRMRISATLGLLAVGIFVGELLVPWLHSRVFAGIFWGGVLGVLAWLLLMAATDMLATQFHFSRLRQDYLVEQAKLHSELRRIQSTAGNGHIEPSEVENGGPAPRQP